MTGVATLFDRWADAQPDAPAVVAADGAAASYGELRERADRLASSLRAWGADREVAVALLLPRSLALVEASLAVLRAGAVVVPLDPDNPRDRLEGLIAASAAAVVLTTAELAARIDVGARVVCLDDPEVTAAVATDPAAPGPVSVHPEQAAYVIFTSGSTGTPKGTVLTQGALVHLVEWHGAFYGLGPDGRRAWAASLGFDVATWELWSALGLGACLCIAPEEARRDMGAMAEWLTERGVTDAFLTTSLGEAAVAAGRFDRTSLRWLTFGGELLHRHPPPGTPFHVVNTYGPTETTVLVTADIVEPADGVPTSGRPIDGVVVRVVGNDGLPVPAGGEGEIVIGGVRLGRGYIGQP
ncbi:MAG: AMP-binding protein, partial [Actinobacteria bacterium]|nr:AMP-binding protein [Actinomycetota bacterium]